MDTDRSGRTLKAYRDLFWKAEQRIKELQASLKAGGEVSERQYQRIKELQAKLDAVNALPDKWRGEWIVRSQDRTENEQAYVDGRLKSANELDKAIGEQE